MRKNIVIIPARAGSKRFLKKNIYPLCGIPLLAYSIKAALNAQQIDEVFISTDSKEIANIGSLYGASIPFLRPENLSGDFITVDEVCSHHIKALEKDMKLENIVVIQPTSPFVNPENIDNALEMLKNNKQFDSVTTVSELDHRHHPYNLGKPISSNKWEHIFSDERKEKRTRVSKPKFFKFSNLIAVRAEIIKNSSRFGKSMGYLVTDEIDSWDIDYKWQADLAETLILKRHIKLNHMNDLLQI